MNEKLGLDEPKEWPDDIVMRERRLRIMVMILSVVTIISCLAVTVQYRQGRIVAQQNKQLSEANNSILKEVQSCTRPGGECYEAGKRTRALLEQEQRQVIEHRDRNEELHHSICVRQDIMAKELGLRLNVQCPPPLHPSTEDGE